MSEREERKATKLEPLKLALLSAASPFSSVCAKLISGGNPADDRPIPAEDEHPRPGKLALSRTHKPKSSIFPPNVSEFLLYLYLYLTF